MSKSTPHLREPVGKALRKAGLSEMPYGYLLREPNASGARSRIYELSMAGVGTIVTICVVVFLLVPALRAMDGASLPQIAISITLLSLATLLLRNSSRGSLMDAEVDFEAEEVRVVRRSARGVAKIESRCRFDQIRSLFVRRSKRKASTNTLCMRVAGSEDALELVRGSEEAMSTLHRRLVRDVNSHVTRATATELAAGPQVPDLPHAAEASKAGLVTA